MSDAGNPGPVWENRIIHVMPGVNGPGIDAAYCGATYTGVGGVGQHAWYQTHTWVLGSNIPNLAWPTSSFCAGCVAAIPALMWLNYMEL